MKMKGVEMENGKWKIVMKAPTQEQVTTRNVNGKLVGRVNLDVLAVHSVELVRVCRVDLSVILNKDGHWPSLKRLLLDLICLDGG